MSPVHYHLFWHLCVCAHVCLCVPEQSGWGKSGFTVVRMESNTVTNKHTTRTKSVFCMLTTVNPL